MKIGTKSILFGVHQFALHPLFVALAWWKLYGFPWDPRLWVAFFVHDIGYFGKPNMDGPEGETHPEFGAKIMAWCFGPKWGEFTLLHSRFLSKKMNRPFSRLCVADKLAITLTPRWLYLIQANLTGEIREYMKGPGARTPAGERSQWQWLTDVQRYCRAWAIEHRDGKQDHWTGTKRDLARSETEEINPTKEPMPDAVNHPPHYNFGKIEIIDAVEDWKLDFHLGNVVKYVARSEHKGRQVEDLKKARWYLDRKIETLEKSAQGAK